MESTGRSVQSIETVIDKLLAKGAQIRDVLDQEVEYAAEQRNKFVPVSQCSRSGEVMSMDVTRADTPPYRGSLCPPSNRGKNSRCFSVNSHPLPKNEVVPRYLPRENQNDEEAVSSLATSHTRFTASAVHTYHKPIDVSRPTSRMTELSESDTIKKYKKKQPVEKVSLECSKGEKKKKIASDSKQDKNRPATPAYTSSTTLPGNETTSATESLPISITRSCNTTLKEDALSNVLFKTLPYTMRRGPKEIQCHAKARVARVPNSKWLLVDYQMNDENGAPIVEIRTELCGTQMRKTVINGKLV